MIDDRYLLLMKYSPLVLLSVFAITLLILPDASPSRADGQPAVPSTPLFSADLSANPIHAADQAVSWWTNSPQVTWVTDVVGQGKGSLKLTNTDPTKSVMVYSPFVPYTGPSINLVAEVKQDSIQRGPAVVNKPIVAVYYYGADRKPIDVPWHNFHDGQILGDGTLDWTSYNRTFTLPSNVGGVAFVRVVVGLVGSGTIWVDKVELSQGS